MHRDSVHLLYPGVAPLCLRMIDKIEDLNRASPDCAIGSSFHDQLRTRVLSPAMMLGSDGVFQPGDFEHKHLNTSPGERFGIRCKSRRAHTEPCGFCLRRIFANYWST